MNLRRMGWTLLPLLTSIAACGTLDPLRPPVIEEAPAECEFPTGTELAFAGEASPFELGLGLENETERTRMYVTAEPVDRGQVGPPERMACSLAGWGRAWFAVPADWTPPRFDDSDSE